MWWLSSLPWIDRSSKSMCFVLVVHLAISFFETSKSFLNSSHKIFEDNLVFISLGWGSIHWWVFRFLLCRIMLVDRDIEIVRRVGLWSIPCEEKQNDRLKEEKKITARDSFNCSTSSLISWWEFFKSRSLLFNCSRSSSTCRFDARWSSSVFF